MEPTTVSLPWLDIAKLALGTGIVAAAINQGASWAREWRKDANTARRESTYLALRIAVILERFAIDCAAKISDNIAFALHGGDVGREHSTLAELNNYPENADWKSLDTNLASRALSIRNEISISAEHVAAMFNIDRGEGLIELNHQSGIRGYRAWKLAAEMRQKYSLPEFDPNETAWDVVRVLKEEHDGALGIPQEEPPAV